MSKDLVTTTLPLARVRRIIKQDDDVITCSSAAVYTITCATELFIQYYAEQAFLMARADKRKKLQYQDFANAVARLDQLEFLSNLVPKTISFKKLLDNDLVSIDKSLPIAKNQARLIGANGQLATSKPRKEENDEDHDSPTVAEAVEDVYGNEGENNEDDDDIIMVEAQ